ncbi:CDP-alcohol phosphatidyltransferase family protein [Mangrovicella endophytica]|uniref:CDP-alcohol phosphatidyltransferase family protein n=1 Tax=Mangrovicella endophytica TaxID=2066697 RepID=UPI000C9EC0C7|nr:CDP-alcohol phosphatidyltransferase family protein [Mangrovicella endophytica]
MTGDVSHPHGPGTTEPARRPLASRSSPLMIRLAATLARGAVTPNQISVLSVVFAALGAAATILPGTPLWWLAAALCVQLRLLCNLLDGMVAIEGGKKSAVGAIYNEFPDRVADSLLLVAPGYAVGLPWLGWAAALLAALTAYVRVLGGSLGLLQDFSGIMAKQRRMALLTLGLVAAAIEAWTLGSRYALTAALAIITAGSLVTCITRTVTIARQLERAA